MSSGQLPAQPPDTSTPVPATARRLPLLLPYLTYVIHTLEELPGFAGWATEHFGPESTGSFAAYHIPLILLVLVVCGQAIRCPHGAWLVLVTAFQWQFAINAVFHLSAWMVLGEYSPGAVTGAVVSVPATIFYFWWLRHSLSVGVRHLSLAIAIGTAIATLAIGFLFL